MKRIGFKACALSMMLLSTGAFLGNAYAQEGRGTIQGKVLDSSGATVAGASVLATNLATNVTNAGKTDAVGAYFLPYLVPGFYKLSASAPGFKKTERSNLQLRMDQLMQVDLTLEIGSVSQTIEVKAQTPLLDVASANLGQIFEAAQVAELPTSDGSPLALVYLTPGTARTFAGAPVNEPELEQNLATQQEYNGLPEGSVEFLLNGVPNTQEGITSAGSGNVSAPPADIVSEFNVGVPYDASVGHSSGVVISYNVKSGSNQLHGTAYYETRSPNWDANSFFGNRSGQPIADFFYKYWGATLTGPVYIPHLYNGRGRTFFTQGYEGLNALDGTGAYIATVPTAAEKQGDFSALLALSSTYQIYDPATTTAVGNGTYSRTAIAGNIIPPGRISPIATAILGHYPAPNYTVGATAAGANNYIDSNNGTPRGYYNSTTRIDHSISDKQRFYAVAIETIRTDGPYRTYWNDPVVGETFRGPGRQVALDDTYTFSPTLVLDVRYGMNFYAGAHAPLWQGVDPATLGFTGTTLAQLTEIGKGLPAINISGLNGMSGESADVDHTTNQTVSAQLIKIHGTHNLKFGGEFRSYEFNYFTPNTASGSFSFSTTYTNGPLNTSTASPSGLGQGMASLLLGVASSGSIVYPAFQSLASNFWSLYLNDNWRIGKRLTVDLGVRWEYQASETERYNRAVNGFNRTASLSITSAAEAAYAAAPDASLPASQFQPVGGILFAGVGGQSRGFWGSNSGNWAPRIGFAYQAAPKMVVRGGFGIYPVQIGVFGNDKAYQNGYSQTTNMVPSLNGGVSFAATLASPFPGGVQLPSGNTLGVNTFVGNAPSFYNPSTPIPYTMEESLGVQYQLPGRILLETSYVGNRCIKLQLARADAGLPDQYLSTLTSRDATTINYLSASIPNPFAGLLPGSTLNANVISRATLLHPYPQFTSLTSINSQGLTWYNSLQMRVERRMGQGVTLTGAFTWSRQMQQDSYYNAMDPVPTRTLGVFDIPKNLALSGIYELPVGRGKAFLSTMPRVADEVLGGWRVSAVYGLESGWPLSWGNIFFNGNLSNIAIPASQRTPTHWFNTAAGFVTASTAQPGSNMRYFPQYLPSVRNGYINNWDMALTKEITIRERVHVDLRAQFLNALNHPYGWAGADTTPTDSGFGSVATMYQNPRITQISVKFKF